MNIYQNINEEPLEGLGLIEHCNKIDDFINWLSKVGINAKKTRISKYANYIKEYANIKDFNPLENDEHHEKFDKFLYALKEVHELLWIWKGIKIKSPDGIEEKLRTVIGGQDFAKDDIDTFARNIQFELKIASYFLQHNYDVYLNGNTDIVARNSIVEFNVECKRVYSLSKLNSHIKKASKQLSCKLKGKSSYSKSYGIATFELTKLVNNNLGLSFCTSYEQCRCELQKLIDKIDYEYDFEEPFNKIKNMIGVWLQIHVPILNIRLGQSTTRFSNRFIIMSPESGPRSKYLKEFKKVYEVTDTIP